MTLLVSGLILSIEKYAYHIRPGPLDFCRPACSVLFGRTILLLNPLLALKPLLAGPSGTCRNASHSYAQDDVPTQTRVLSIYVVAGASRAILQCHGSISIFLPPLDPCVRVQARGRLGSVLFVPSRNSRNAWCRSWVPKKPQLYSNFE